MPMWWGAPTCHRVDEPLELLGFQWPNRWPVVFTWVSVWHAELRGRVLVFPF